MGEISAASSEQSTGVAQVGEAVTQMDQATQQNAALVEESAAAAESLKVQAQQLVQAVSVFKLGGANQGQMVRSAPTLSAPTMTRGKSAPAPGKKRKSVAPALARSQATAPVAKAGGGDEGEWASF